MSHSTLTQRKIASALCLLTLLSGVLACNLFSTPTQPRPTTSAAQIVFTADRYNVPSGECAMLQWSVQGGFGTELNEQPVEESGQMQVCPGETTVYTLTVYTRRVDTDAASERREITIFVEQGTPVPPAPPPQPPPPTSTPPTLTPTHTPTPTATLTQPPPPGGGFWGVTTADLAVTDLFPDNWPQGRIFVSITNNGPDSLSNIPNNQLSCTVGMHPYSGAPPHASGSSAPVTLSLVPGQTEAYDTGITVDGATHWYKVTCSIQANFKDPNPSNDSYSETFPPPP